MPGPKPDDNYNPVPSVEPTTGAPNDYLSVRANPNSFGADVGQATEKLGSTMGQVGNDAAGIAIQQLGLANEHAANQADLQLATQGGEIYDQYKSLSGLAASTSKDSYIGKYSALYQQISSEMPNPAARRAFEQTAIRRMSFTIQDMNSYAAQQQKSAYTKGFDDQISLAKDQLSKIDVASDPKQMNWELGSLTFALNSKLTAPGVGPYSNISATTNSDGTLSFDTSTKEGKLAQADYDNQLLNETGKAYETAIETVANDLSGKGGYDKAYALMNSLGDKLPGSVKASLMKSLRGPFLAEDARAHVEDRLAVERGKYNAEQADTAPSGPVAPGAAPSPITPEKLTDAFIGQESSNGKTSTNLGQIQPGTWSLFAKSGEDINNPKDNRAVTQRILTKYSNDYRNPDGSPDVGRVAVAYFSGTGNVAPPGSATPWITDYADSSGKHVSSYVPDIQSKTGGISAPAGSVSFATWLGYHSSDIGEELRKDAADRGLDATGQDMVASRWHSRVAELNSYQQEQIKYNRDIVAKVVMDPQHPVTNMTMLENSSDPKVRDALHELQKDDYWSTLSIENRVKGNALGASKSYGTAFSDNLLDVLSGKVSDPTHLSEYIGGDKSPISTSGYAAIEKTAQLNDSQKQNELKFLQLAKKTITGSGLPGVDGAARQPLYEKFVQSILPQIEMMRGEGKSDSEIFGDTKGPIFRAMEGNTIDPTQIKHEAGGEAVFHMINQRNQGAAGLDLSTIKTPADLQKNAAALIKSGQFDQVAVSLGLARPDEAAPSVPGIH